MSDPSQNLGPLTGIRVIDLTINVLGPVATQILGDMGAEVIKVETPSGDPMRQIGVSNTGTLGPFFQTTNRNKKSIILNLKRIAMSIFIYPTGRSQGEKEEYFLIT